MTGYKDAFDEAYYERMDWLHGSSFEPQKVIRVRPAVVRKQAGQLQLRTGQTVIEVQPEALDEVLVDLVARRFCARSHDAQAKARAAIASKKTFVLNLAQGSRFVAHIGGAQ